MGRHLDWRRDHRGHLLQLELDLNQLDVGDTRLLGCLPRGTLALREVVAAEC